MEMYEITVEGHFSAAHFLENYEGKCASVHGHRWNVKLSAVLKKNENSSMLVDFGEIKDTLNSILDDMDHAFIIDPFGNDMSMEIYAVLKKYGVRVYDFKGRTTAENIAKHIYEEIEKRTGWTTHTVEVFEAPGNSVKYKE